MDALIGKFLSGEANPDEAMLLEDWIAESDENKRHFEQSAKAFGLVEKAISTDHAWEKVQGELKQAPIRKLNILPHHLQRRLGVALLWCYSLLCEFR